MKSPLKVSITEANPGSQNLVLSLKRANTDMRKEIESKDSQIEELKRNIKLTQFNTMAVELNTYKQECVRLRAVAEENVTDFTLAGRTVNRGADDLEQLKM
jgi:hypothetical protein